MLTKLQALLLLGGAFGICLAAWVGARYRLVAEPEYGIYGNAATVITVYGNDGPTRRFLERMTASSSDTVDVASLGPRSATTLYAILDPEYENIGIYSSGTFEGLFKLHPSRLRLIPRDVQGIGFVRLPGTPHRHPVELRLGDGRFIARVGLDFRGPTFHADPFSRGRRLIRPMRLETAYLEKPEGISWKKGVGLLTSELQRFQGQAGPWALPGRLEMAVSASETPEVLNPFVLYYRPKAGQALPREALETYAKSLLSEADPAGIEIALPDGTEMLELRNDPGAVRVQRKKVRQFGELAELTAPGGRDLIHIFYADDGEAWLSTDVGLIQASLVGNVGWNPSEDPCEAGGQAGFASFPGKTVRSWPVLAGIERLTFTVNDHESGMFTMCGYFMP